MASVAASAISAFTTLFATGGALTLCATGLGAAGTATTVTASLFLRAGNLPLGKSPPLACGARLALPIARSISPRYLRASGLVESIVRAVSKRVRACEKSPS